MVKYNFCIECGRGYDYNSAIAPQERKEMAEFNFHNYVYLTCGEECYHKKLKELGYEPDPDRVRREDFEKRLLYLEINQNNFEADL